jgi:DNA-binding GntR family transcriptional regulator
MRAARERGDHAGVAEHEIAFHRSLIEMAGDPSLMTIWSMIVGQLRGNFQRAHAEYDDLKDIYLEHVAIVSAFRAGDKEAAVEFFAQRIGHEESDFRTNHQRVPHSPRRGD